VQELEAKDNYRPDFTQEKNPFETVEPFHETVH
jgi:hypothetical protein